MDETLISRAQSVGQQTSTWVKFWGVRTPDAEIRQIDCLCLRPWVVKYAPRFGKVIEAGCGLGKYVFYLHRLGIDVEGLEFSDDTVNTLRDWQITKGLAVPFRVGDVTQMPYPDCSLAGYLSFGVVEHFQEGPMRPLAEAHRVLRPGGIAVVTTPAPGYARRITQLQACYRLARSALGSLKRWRWRASGASCMVAARALADGLRGRTETYIDTSGSAGRRKFWQYEYPPRLLAEALNRVGFRVVEAIASDLRFNEYILRRWHPEIPREMARLRWLDRLEGYRWTDFLKAFAVVVAVKLAPRMHCFLCGQLNATELIGTVPICRDCQRLEAVAYYAKRRYYYHYAQHEYDVQRRPLAGERQCATCGKQYSFDRIFGDSGFSEDVCERCLRTPAVNLRLSNTALRLTWVPPIA